jgi:hypothetical protein
MPELAAMYLVGFIISVSLTFVYQALRRRRRKSVVNFNLQNNLRKAGLFWSEDQDKVIEWNQAQTEAELDSSERSHLIVGLLLSFLSWVGFFFLFILMISDRYLTRSRKEKALFASELALDPDLNVETVRALANDSQTT